MFSPTRQWICRFSILVFLALWLSGIFAIAQKPSMLPAAEELEWGIYGIPSSFVFTTPDVTDQKKGWKLRPGVVPMTGREGLYDVKAILKAAGITQPPGSLAIFSRLTSTLITRNTRSNIDMCDTIVSGPWFDWVTAPKVTLSVIEYALPSINVDWKSPSPLAYAELEKLAAGSIKVLSEVTFIGKSGQRQTGGSGMGAAETGQKRPDDIRAELAPFKGSETGIRYISEPTLGPDGQTVNMNVMTRFRVELESGNPKSAFSGDSSFASDVWIGCPVVVQSFSKPGAKGEFVALILRVDLANPGGWKVPAR